MAAAARGARAARWRHGPLRRTEIEELVGKPAARGVGLWVDLVRVPPSGTWERRRADLYARAEDWVGPPAGGEDERAAAGVEHLVRRYLAGVRPGVAGRHRALGRASGGHDRARARAPEAAALRVRGRRRAASTSRARRCRDPDTPAPVRFLPTWDATLLVHVRARAGSSPRSTGRGSSTRRTRSRSRRSSSTARSPGRGGTTPAGSTSSRSTASTARRPVRCARRRNGSRPSTREASPLRGPRRADLLEEPDDAPPGVRAGALVLRRSERSKNECGAPG